MSTCVREVVHHGRRRRLHQQAAHQHHQQRLKENRDHGRRRDMAGGLAVAAEIRRVQGQCAGRADQQVDGENELVRVRMDAHAAQHRRLELAAEQQGLGRRLRYPGDHDEHHPGQHDQEADDHQGRGAGHDGKAECREQHPGDGHRAVQRNSRRPAVVQVEEEQEASIQQAVLDRQEADDQKAEDDGSQRRTPQAEPVLPRDQRAGEAGLHGDAGHGPAQAAADGERNDAGQQGNLHPGDEAHDRAEEQDDQRGDQADRVPGNFQPAVPFALGDPLEGMVLHDSP
ncbi:MAG: hypothetical protein MUE63_15465 [Xanthomonadales bacterium]|nr:hypothetical protein [Xanthomonadales bacterium]